MLFGRLRRLGARPTSPQVLAALREAYFTAFLLPAVPGALLGALLGPRGQLPVSALIALLAVAAALAALVVWLALRARTGENTPLAGAVRSSLQLASAPAVPFLMGCALLGQPLALDALWGLAAGLLLLGLALLRP